MVVSIIFICEQYLSNHFYRCPHWHSVPRKIFLLLEVYNDTMTLTVYWRRYGELSTIFTWLIGGLCCVAIEYKFYWYCYLCNLLLILVCFKLSTQTPRGVLGVPLYPYVNFLYSILSPPTFDTSIMCSRMYGAFKYAAVISDKFLWWSCLFRCPTNVLNSMHHSIYSVLNQSARITLAPDLKQPR